MDLVNQLLEKINELNTSIKLLRSNGEKLAEAERDYRVAVSKEVMLMKEEKLPATLINLTIYGRKSVADVRFKRDIAQVMYDSNIEHINVTKVQVRVLENQIQREWK
jgi:hypothetical protein